MTRKKNYLSKALCIFMSVLMCLSVCMLDWSGISQTADATTITAGQYWVKLVVNMSREKDKDTQNCRVNLYYKGNNGRGSESSIGDKGFSGNQDGDQVLYNGWVSGFPSKMFVHMEIKEKDSSAWATVKAYVGPNSSNLTNLTWKSVSKNDYDLNNQQVRSWRTVTGSSASIDEYTIYFKDSHTPYLNAVSLNTSSSSVTANNYGGGNKTYTPFTASATDQYGVAWGCDVSWAKGTDNYNGCTVNSSTGALTIPQPSGQDTGKTVKVTASSGGKSATGTVTVDINKYHVDLNGSIDGSNIGNISGYGKANVTIGGVSKATNAEDFYTEFESGKSYSIQAVNTVAGYTCSNPTISGTIGGATVDARLNYTTNKSTLTVDPNSGSWDGNTSTTSYTQNKSTNKSIPIPTKTGWVFTGWTKSAPFNGTLSSTTAAGTYTYSLVNGVNDTITAHWKRDITNTYNYYQADATTNAAVTKSGTATDTASTLAITSPTASDVVTQVTKNDKTWTLKGWSALGTTSTVWGDANQTAPVGLNASHNVNTTASSYSFYPVYALSNTRFYANYHFNRDGAVDAYTQTYCDVAGNAATGAMPLPTVNDTGSGTAAAHYYSIDGQIYALTGWSRTQGAQTPEVAWNASSFTLNVPGAGDATSTANLTPIDLYPVYELYGTTINARYYYFDATTGTQTYLDLAGKAEGAATTGTLILPTADQVDETYTVDGVTYTLQGWNRVNESETTFVPCGDSISGVPVWTHPATEFYTFYPVYTCTTTVKYHINKGSLAQEVITKTTTLIKTNANTPTQATVEAPTSFNENLTLNGRTFSYQGWRNDTVNGEATIESGITSVTHTIQDTPYNYYAIYKNDEITLSYDGTTDGNGIDGAPIPASQIGTQYFNSGLGNAEINKVNDVTFTVNPEHVTPTKTGYTFIGWQLTDNWQNETAAFAKWGGNYTTKVNTTLYAVYSINTVYAKFTYWDSTTNNFKTDSQGLLYNDGTRSDAAAARFKTTGPLLDTAVIDHADQTKHYKFTGWRVISGNATPIVNTNGSKKSVTVSYATSDVVIQAMYQGFSHHWVTVIDATHPYTPANCNNPGTYYHVCSDCGYAATVEVPVTEHELQYSGYLPASCTADGRYATAFCANCVLRSTDADFEGSAYYDYVNGAYVPVESTDGVIAKLNHNYVLTGTVAPTCVVAGYKVYTCTHNSGHVVYNLNEGDAVPALGHSNFITTPGVEATCTTYGYTASEKCGVCGYLVTDKSVISALGHTPVTDVAVSETCTTAGKTEGSHCSVCDEVIVAQETIPSFGGHDYEATEATDATCTAPGHTAGTVCTRCGELGTADETASALGHTWQRDGYVAGTDDVYTESAMPCKVAGYRTFTCPDCDAVVVVKDALTAHTPVEVEAKAATCTSVGYEAHYECSVCETWVNAQGEPVTPSYIAKLEHSYEDSTEEGETAVDATCTTNGRTAKKICSVCGAELASEVIEALGHEMGEWAYTVAPTCIVAGVEERSCIRCGGETEQRVAQALGHDYQPVAEVPATGTTYGRTAGVVCTRCGDIESGCEYIPMTEDHIFGAWVVTEAPTCTSFGHRKQECSHCGLVIEEDIPMLNHSFVDLAPVAPTCISIGHEAGRECSECHFVEGYLVIPVLNHGFTELVSAEVPANCTTNGTTAVYKCPNCNEQSGGEAIPALGHQYGEWEVIPATCLDDGLKTRICSVCGHTDTEVISAPGSHDMIDVPSVPASCTTGGFEAGQKCSRCDYKTGMAPIEQLGHNVESYNVTAPATCQQTGIKEGTCARCGETVTVVIPVTDHDYEDIAAKAATCGAAGHTAGQKCRYCGETIGLTEIAPSGEHTYPAEGTVEIPATCSSTGITNYICTVCSNVDARETPVLDHEYVYVAEVPASCTATGLSGYTYCANCDYATERVVIDKTTHTEKTVGAVAPNCTEKGSTGAIICEVCETVIANASEIAALGHKMSAWETVSRPTCTEDGSRVRNCKVCGNNEDISYTNKLGHNMIKHEAIEPRCEVNGYAEYYECTRCAGKYFADEAGTIEIAEADLTISALTHVWGDPVNVAPTCTTEGYTKVKCTLCGAENNDNYVDCLGHTGGTADCVNVAICTVCGKAYGELSGHNYVETSVTPATCQTLGTVVKTCTVCGKEITSHTGVGQHKFIDEEAYRVDVEAPGCTTAGSYSVKCAYCDEVKSGYVIAATGHTDANSDNICDECGETLSTTGGDDTPDAPGVHDTCDKCGKDHGGKQGGLFGYDGLICKILAFFKMIINLFK